MRAPPRARAPRDRTRLRVLVLPVAELTSQRRSGPPRPRACPPPSRLPPSAMPDPDICLASTGAHLQVGSFTATWKSTRIDLPFATTGDLSTLSEFCPDGRHIGR